MRQSAAKSDPVLDFRTMVLACADVPQFVARFNDARNCALDAPLDELIDDRWIFDLEQPDAEVRGRAMQIAAFVAFVHTTVWQPYIAATSRSCSITAM